MPDINELFKLQQYHTDIEEYGDVVLQDATIGVMSELRKHINQLDELERPQAFATSLISALMVSPKISPSEVEQLSEESIDKLTDLAITVVGMAKQYQALESIGDKQERLYKAYLAYLGDLIIAPFTSAFKKWTEIADSFKTSPIANAIASAEQINKAFSNISFPMPELGQTSLLDTLRNAGLNSYELHTPTYTFPPFLDNAEPIEEDSESEALRIHNDASDIIYRLENRLRKFIENKLRSLYGDMWWKRGVPEGVRKGCEERKTNKEVKIREKLEPIFYAYFNDYKDIIVNGNNWKSFFSKVFDNRIQLEACLQWVQEVRDANAHNRPISDSQYAALIFSARWLHEQIDNDAG